MSVARRIGLRMFVVLGAITFLVVASACQFTDRTASTSDVVWFLGTPDEGELIDDASSRLVRRDNSLSMTFNAADLPPGTAQTIWWVIFNEPENCDTSPCGVPDIFAEEPNATVMFAAGEVVDDDGTADFRGRLGTDDTSGCLRPGVPVDLEDNIEMFFPCNPLENAREAEVQLMVHDHGPVIPEIEEEMLTTYDGGCENMGHPDEIEERQGLNTCATIQNSIHQP